jgi:hypothetical protein
VTQLQGLYKWQRHSASNQSSSLNLLGNANNTASGTGPGVASLQRLLVSSLAEIVSASVDDDGAL